jgi:hypothetical protein
VTVFTVCSYSCVAVSSRMLLKELLSPSIFLVRSQVSTAMTVKTAVLGEVATHSLEETD